MSTVDQLPGNLVYHGNPGRLAVHLRLQTLEPEQRRLVGRHKDHQHEYFKKMETLWIHIANNKQLQDSFLCPNGRSGEPGWEVTGVSRRAALTLPTTYQSRILHQRFERLNLAMKSLETVKQRQLMPKKRVSDLWTCSHLQLRVLIPAAEIKLNLSS